MIRWFENVDVANAWLLKHPLERLICLAPGHLSGSVLIATKPERPVGRPVGSKTGGTRAV